MPETKLLEQISKIVTKAGGIGTRIWVNLHAQQTEMGNFARYADCNDQGLEFRQWSCGPISTFVVTETCEMHCPFLVSITTDLQAFAEKKRNACTCNNKRNAF